MSNSCEQTPILSNTAEIADNIGWVKNTLLKWSKFNPTFIQTSHSVGVSRITKN